jgi:hypothetical protein
MRSALVTGLAVLLALSAAYAQRQGVSVIEGQEAGEELQATIVEAIGGDDLAVPAVAFESATGKGEHGPVVMVPKALVSSLQPPTNGQLLAVIADPCAPVGDEIITARLLMEGNEPRICLNTRAAEGDGPLKRISEPNADWVTDSRPLPGIPAAIQDSVVEVGDVGLLLARTDEGVFLGIAATGGEGGRGIVLRLPTEAELGEREVEWCEGLR